MEEYMVFVWLVVVIFGILSVILFFKVWGMTDEIKVINKKIGSIIDIFKTPKEEPSPIFLSKAAFFQGDLARAKAILDEALFKEYTDIHDLEDSFGERFESLVSRYKPLYDAMKIDAPDFEKLRNRDF